ncbi:MAG: COR domain-containing protein [Rhodobacter sp.]|nr:COR domain-containing protein [Rhodobacter sp.]
MAPNSDALDTDAALREAETRIAAWQLGEVLDLSIDRLAVIPESIREIAPTEIVLTRFEDHRSVGATQVSDLGPLAGLTALQNLDCRNTQVSDLGPLAELTALQSLTISGTEVSDLGPLAGLTALQSLTCSSTEVSDLAPLASLAALQSLDCSRTQVSDLAPLASLAALQSLDCSSTQFSDLAPLAGLAALQSLYCGSNYRFTDLNPLSGLIHLQSLDFWNGLVDDLSPLADLTALKYLNCSYTQVVDLTPLKGLLALEILRCTRSFYGSGIISDLAPLAGLTALQSLDCSDTQVSDLAPLAGLASLQNLDCSSTQVSNLAPLARLTALQSLTCSSTEVSDLAPLTSLAALQSLDCSRTQVSDLAPLAGLTALQKLDCNSIQLSDLAPLAGLTALQSLTCRSAQVNDLAPLAGLTALQKLDCSSTQVSDLAPLAGLTALQSLTCRSTQVGDLSPLAGITALQRLECSDTKVNDLGPLAGFIALQSLTTSGTKISDISPLAGLTALQSLTISDTKVSDLGPLAGITTLQSLTISDTKVSDLGPLAGITTLQSIRCLNCKINIWEGAFFEQPALEELVATHLDDVPSEVLSQGPSDNCLPRLRAHLLDMKDGAEPLRDAKLLVLGNGRVGKTQLVRSLFGEGLDESVASTHGITVRPYDLTETPDNVPARLWIWDFGGQDIYHSTHTLFMKSRGIYLLGWTPVHEDNETHHVGGLSFRNHKLPYWLTQIGAFGGQDLPLIVVQTQADKLKDRCMLDEVAQRRMDAFPNAVTLHHSAQTGRGQQDLEEALQEAYASIEQPLVGKIRVAVKRALEDMIAKGTERIMSVEAFRTLCDERGGVAVPALFLETLHNAGVVFYRDGYFAGDIILDQQWAITAIYSVLERESKVFRVIESMKGAFTRPLLGELIWDEHYTVKEQVLFLSMMQSCGICFARERSVGEAEALYIAPDLLPMQRPPGWDGADAEAIQTRRYTALPSALIRSIISAIGDQAQQQGDYWRTGLCVYERLRQGWVLIETHGGEDHAGQLTIRTNGAKSEELLQYIAKTVEVEEARLGLSPLEIEGSNDRPSETEAHEATEQDATYDRPDSATNDWFFSYANDDEHADRSKPVATFCKRIEDDKGIIIRRDVNELDYGDEIEPFMRDLSAGSRIYIWLTDNYLKSPYCLFELHEIWLACERDPRKLEDRVVVLFGDADVRDEVGQKAYRDYWDKQLDAAYDRLRRSPDPLDVAETLGRISGFVQVLSHLLSFIQARIRYTDFNEMTEEELRSG